MKAIPAKVVSISKNHNGTWDLRIHAHPNIGSNHRIDSEAAMRLQLDDIITVFDHGPESDFTLPYPIELWENKNDKATGT